MPLYLIHISKTPDGSKPVSENTNEETLEPSGVFASSFLISASTSVSYFNATSISMLPSASTAIDVYKRQSHFCRAFSEAVGVTPKEYKNGKLP